jgi:phage/plasmid-like protein (TIGR03299 family)
MDNIHHTNGAADFAFAGDRNDIWHRMGQAAQPGWTPAQWRQAAHLDFTAIKLPAFVSAFDVPSIAGDVAHKLNTRFDSVPNAHFIARDDTGALLSDKSVSDVYQPHQIADLQETMQQYCDVDTRFKFSTIGALGSGSTVFMCAEYAEPQSIGGDAFKAYLLATTSFDSTQASRYQASTIRTVCQNTLNAAIADARGVVRVRHNTRFDKVEASKQLATILQSVERFKAIGDAMLAVHMAADAVSAFFKSCLDIPFDSKRDDVSTRKLNQFAALNDAYLKTVNEGTQRLTAWSAFNAVTRYVDHDRSVRGGADVETARFASAQFGAGAQLKDKAFNLLLPLVKDKVAA